jgi:two-component system sensor histidine kinase YesM
MKIFRLSKLNLRTKLIILYFLTIFIPLLVTVQIILSVSGKKIIEQTTNITQESSQQTAINIQVLLNQYVDIVNRLSYDQELNNYLNPNRVYKTDLESIDAYSLYLKPVTFYDFNIKEPMATLNILFLNKTLLQDHNTFYYADEDVQKQIEYITAVAAKGELVWGKVGDRKVGNRNVGNQIYLSRAMYNNQHQLVAVVSMMTPETRFNSLFQERDKSEKMMLITDQTGAIISSNTQDQVGRSANGKSFIFSKSLQPIDVVDTQTGKTYKVLVQALGDGLHYPDWRLVTMIPLDRLIHDEQKNRRSGLIVSSLALLLSCGIFILALNRITDRVKLLVKKMQSAKSGDLSILEDEGASDEIGALTKSFNVMIENLQRSIYENYEVNLKLKDSTIKKQEAELYALQNQINPHFLFNTLESIRMGLHNKGDHETAVIVLNFSKLFRNLLNWQGEFIPLREEIELVKKYLSIQKYRFEDRFYYEITLPEILEDAYIPKLTIQPIVENAFKHGIEYMQTNGTIFIRVEAVREGVMSISIEDNGSGMLPDKLESIQQELALPEIKKTGSIGLKNVNDRILIHFGRDYGITIESQPEHGTSVRIIMPIFYNVPSNAN